MDDRTRESVLGIVGALAVGVAVGWAGSQGSATAFGWPVFAICAALSYLINWVAFVPAYRAQTEHYYDLTGAITNISLPVVALVLSGAVSDPRALLITALVAIWAGRLGSFLFRRVRVDGKDGRFDTIKPDFLRFLMAWTVQATWCLLNVCCGLAAITTAEKAPLGVVAAVGLAIWLLGFGIEVVADRQKSAFRADPANEGRFISTGLWAWSRHPNYFGEIVLWIGVTVIAVPVLSGWQFVTLISPLFVIFILTRVSGVPMLEARGNKRWGDEPAYQAYLERTPVLIPRPPRTA